MLLKRHGGESDKLIKKLIFASMAQLVEQLIRNEQVVGSSPTTSSILVIPNGYSPEKARIYGLF